MDNDMESYPSQMYNVVTQTSTGLNRHDQTISEQQQELSSEQLRDKLRKQLEYYFSKENIINDSYLQSQMDAENYVPISMIANFKLAKRLTDDLQLIIDVLKESPLVEVDIDEKRVRSLDNKIQLPTRKRCIIILRNVPLDATENEILQLFINETCLVSAVGCERVLESDHSDCWYVTFNSEDDAQNAFLYLTRESISIRGQKILARMKACLWQKPAMSSDDGITKPSIPQKSLSVSTQEQYTPVYPPSARTNHTNQPPFLRNLPQQQQQPPSAMNYHHRQVLQPQVHFPINYLPHQHSIQSTLPFAPNPSQMNMSFYPQTQYMNRNPYVFPSNFWYLPSSTMDSYSPMSYNGISKPKHRLNTPKLRQNSTKPISQHNGISVNNNNLDNSSPSKSSHLENNHSSSSDHETALTRSSGSDISSTTTTEACQDSSTELQQLTRTNESTNQHANE